MTQLEFCWTWPLAISLTSDVVLGVANAADPGRRRAATERLERLSTSSDGGWAATVRRAAPERPRPAVVEGVPTSTASNGASRPVVAPRVAVRKDAPAKEFRELEAFMLQGFLQAMLPQNARGVFGKGIAGETWKSMLAEKLAANLAQSGQIGLAAHLAVAKRPGTAVSALMASAVEAGSFRARPRHDLAGAMLDILAPVGDAVRSTSKS